MIVGGLFMFIDYLHDCHIVACESVVYIQLYVNLNRHHIWYFLKDVSTTYIGGCI